MNRPAFSLVLSLSGFLTIAACTRTSAQSGSAESAGAASANQRLTDLVAAPETRRVIAKSGNIDTEGQPSPDGKVMTITDWSTGDLALYDIASGTIRRLTNKGSWDTSTEFAEATAMSPDGKSVAYGWWADAKKQFEMRVISISGADSGKVRTVYSAPDLGYVAPQTWTPDGKNVIAAVQLNDRTSHIAIVPVNGGAVKRLKSFDWRYPTDMELSPDGKWLAYDFPPEEDNTTRDVYVVALDGSREKAVATGKSDELVVGWTTDGSRLLFSSTRSGTPAVWAVSVESGEPRGEPVLVRSDMWRMFPIGRDASGKFFYSVSTGARDIYTAILDPKTGRITSEPVAAGGSPTTTIPYAASWSPDGRQIATLSVRGTGTTLYGPSDVVIRSIERDEVRRISPKLSRASRIYWMPDGRSFLLRGHDLKGRPGIFRMDLQSGDVKVVKSSDTPNFGQMLSIARDGKTAYLMAWDSAFKTASVNRLDIATGEMTVIHQETLPVSIVGLAVSPDGKQLAMNLRGGSYGNGVATLLPVAGGTPKEIYRFPPTEAPNMATGMTWTPDAREIVFGVMQRSDELNQKVEVRALPIDGRPPRSLGAPAANISALALSPDGRRIAYGINAFSDELWIMQPPKFELRSATTR